MSQPAMPPPRHFCWFDSPFAGALAIALLLEPRDRNWESSDRQRPSPARRARAHRASANAQLLAQTDAAGHRRQPSQRVGHPRIPRPASGHDSAEDAAQRLPRARGSRRTATSRHCSRSPPTARSSAPRTVSGVNAGVLRSGLFCHRSRRLVSQSFFSGYSFTQMAMDEGALGSARRRHCSRRPGPSRDRSVRGGRGWAPRCSRSIPMELHVDADGAPSPRRWPRGRVQGRLARIRLGRLRDAASSGFSIRPASRKAI